MVILAMHVISDGTPKSNMTSTWNNRQKPAFWNDKLQNFVEGDARLTTKYTRLLIEADESIELPGADLAAVTIDATVAITAPCSVGQQRIICDDFR